MFGREGGYIVSLSSRVILFVCNVRSRSNVLSGDGSTQEGNGR